MARRVITIAREFGSGGTRIAKKLARELDIPVYDREILKLASQESGIKEELFAQADEVARRNPLLRAIRAANNGQFIPSPPDTGNYLSDENLFRYQAKVIRELTQEQDCVIIGRCADFILRDVDYVLNVFVHAPLENRIEEEMRIRTLSRADAEKLTRKTDKRRADYYRYFTGRDWRDAAHYDLCLNTGRLNIDQCVEMVRAALEIMGK